MRKILKYIALTAIGWLLINASHTFMDLYSNISALLEYGTRGISVVDELTKPFKEGLSVKPWLEALISVSRNSNLFASVYYYTFSLLALCVFALWLKVPNFITASILPMAGLLGGPVVMRSALFIPLLFPFASFVFGCGIIAQLLWERFVTPRLAKRKRS